MVRVWFKTLVGLSSMFVLTRCGEIVSDLNYSQVKGQELSWANRVDISSVNISNYVVAGRCVQDYGDVTVSVGNPSLASQVITCVSGRFDGFMDLSSVGLAEGFTEVNATQISLSASAQVQVLVDTIVPGAPTIITPMNGSSVSTANISVTGSCDTGNTVNISGDFTGSPVQVSCVSSSFVRAVNLILGNGPKVINATQADSVGNISPAAVSNITLGILPPAPTVTAPANGALTNSVAQNIIGGCETGATVNITGDVVGGPISGACAGSLYNISVTLTALNGIKNYSVSQTNTAGASPSTARTLNLDSTAPSAPTITSPMNGALTNLTAQTVTGACETGATVSLTGNITGGPLTAACTASMYSRAVTLTGGDGAKSISATQTDPAGNTSAATMISITLDQTAPTAPTITSPSNGTLTNLTAQTIVGACETGALVSVSGAITGSPVTTSCVGSVYSRAVTLTAANGSKSISVNQTDVAGNLSASSNISITLDNMAPTAPTIATPANGSFTNQTAQTLTGACETGATVNLSGNFTGSPTSTTCMASNYSTPVTITAGDGSKTITVSQTDVAGNTSVNTNSVFTLDTVVSPITITFPVNGSFTNDRFPVVTGGSCEPGALITITGSLVMTYTTTCTAGGTYSRPTTYLFGDGSKTVTVRQTDLAGNISTTTSVTVTYDTVAPAAPTITAPTNGITTNSVSQTVTGACETNATVSISGAGVASAPVTGPCTASAYSININLTAGNGAKTITASQADQSTNVSASTSISINYTNLNVTYPATFNGIKYIPLNDPSAGISPTIISGTPTSYSISPALPAGLSFNTTTGVFSGRTNISDEVGQTYTITINDAFGSIQRTMFLRIVIPDYTWMGTAGDGLWSTGANWRIGAVPPVNAWTYFDNECLVSGNCNANINLNTQIRRVYMKPTYTGTISQLPGFTFQVGNRSSNGNTPRDWGKWEMEAGTFVGGNSALTIDRINIIGGSFTSTSGVLRMGSNHTFRNCGEGEPGWDWKGLRDCGLSLYAPGSFNHNNGSVLIEGSANTFGRETFSFFLDEVLNLVNFTFNQKTNNIGTFYNGAQSYIYGSSKIISISNSLLWQDGFISLGEIRYQGLNAIFQCDSLATQDVCASYIGYAQATDQPSNVQVTGVQVHTWIRFNRNDGTPQTYTFDDGAGVPGFLVDNPNGVNPIPTNPPVGYLKMGRLEMRQGVFTAPPELSFGEGLDTRFATGGIAASLGVNVNGGSFNHNNGFISFDGFTDFDDNRTALGIRALTGINFNDVEVNIDGDRDLNGPGDGYHIFIYQNSVVNIEGDLTIRNGRFNTPTTNSGMINLYGDLNLLCPNVAQKDCYGRSDSVDFNFLGNVNTQIFFEPMGPGFISGECDFTINKTLNTNRVTLIGNGGSAPNNTASPIFRITNGIFDIGTSQFFHGHNFVNNGAVQCTVGTGYFQYTGTLTGTPQAGNQPACYGP